MGETIKATVTVGDFHPGLVTLVTGYLMGGLSLRELRRVAWDSGQRWDEIVALIRLLA